MRRNSAAYWLALAVCAVLTAGGVLGVAAHLLADGGQPARWGYVAAALVFVLSTCQSAPLLAFGTRIWRAFWGVPLRRTADLFLVSGVVTTPLLIVLLLQLPDWRDRHSIWSDWPGAPVVWDTVAIVLLTVLGLVLLYLCLAPDLRERRPSPTPPGDVPSWVGGTPRQWLVLTTGVVWLGGYYALLFGFLHLLVASDLGLSLVPGWHSAIFPAYQVITAFQGGVATTVIAIALLRRLGGRREIGRDTFHAAGQLLLAFALLYFYFVWCELLTYWYGRMPIEIQLLQLFMFGPVFWLFVLSALLNCVLPVLLLVWSAVRHSVGGVTLVAVLVLAGNLIDRVRLYVTAWSLAGAPDAALRVPAAIPAPGPADVLVFVGAPAAVLLLYLLTLRLVPSVSRWEWRAASLLRTERRYLRTEVPVVAKPN